MHRYCNGQHREKGIADLGLESNLQCTLIHSIGEIRSVAEKLEGWMRLLGYPWRDIFAATLVLHEAASNAVRHGNRRDPAKWVRISFLVTPAEVLVGVEDQGNGFDLDLAARPFADAGPDRPGGRGLLLMRAYSSWLIFDPPGNRVTMCRRHSN